MPAGRPPEFDTELALDSAMQLFWSNGYEATSVQDLLDVMRLSRSSLYQTFGNKHRLFLSCLDRYQHVIGGDLSRRLEHATTGLEFIEGTLAWAIEEAATDVEPRGCLVVNSASEFAQSDTRVALSISKGFDRFRSVFQVAVERGQRDGSVRCDDTSERLAEYLVTTMSGLRVAVQAGTSLETLRGTVAVATRSIADPSPREESE